MIFKIPKTIKIRGKVWTVHRRSTFPYDKDKARDLAGMTYRCKREIHLARHYSARDERRTFLHELFHACVRKSNLVPAKHEEDIIREVEAPFEQALRQLKWK